MYKIFLFVFLFSISSFALTLEQIRNDIKTNSLAEDSVEINIRTMVESIAGEESVSIYIVRKGPSKIYTEIRNSFINKRSIVNGSRIKVID